MKIFVSQRGFVQGYALLAIGIVVAGLSLTCWALWEKAKAAGLRADAAELQAATFRQAAEDAEVQIEALRISGEILDRQLAKSQERERALNVRKAQIQQELDALKTTLPQADQDCLNRPLPDALVERLRVHGTPDADKDGKAKGPGSDDAAVHR